MININVPGKLSGAIGKSRSRNGNMPLASSKSIENSKKNSLANTQVIPSTITVCAKNYSRKSSASRNDKRFKVYDTNVFQDNSQMVNGRDLPFNKTMNVSQSCMSIVNNSKPSKKTTHNKESKGTSKVGKAKMATSTNNEIKLQ